MAGPLRTNQLTGPIPAELGNLTNLQVLFLSFNQLTGPFPDELGNLTNLQVLGLADNQLTGCVPVGLRDVADTRMIFGNSACPTAALRGAAPR